MEREQELEWLEARKIAISEDLVAAAEQQLEFLAAVDRRRFLYDGPILERAIHRYKTFWLPLLARYTESGDPNGPLFVPLDCEWIWHCHRLNPVQYKKDCEELYGSVLDNKNVQSTVGDTSKHRTADIWTNFYPDEPFELESRSSSAESNFIKYTETSNAIAYDLVIAVKRQSSFYYQVCRSIMHDKRFLDEAVSRYKGFLHLIKRNREKSIECFCVPTYDIDLIWHSHQLQPISYQRDMVKLLGKVLEHDDTDSDRTKGKKLDTGFSGTTKQWEDTYGLRYWKAGAMYRGSVPAVIESAPLISIFNQTHAHGFHRSEVSLPFQRTMIMEVFLEIVGIRNLPTWQKGNVFVSFTKKKPDIFLNGSYNLTIFSETGEKKVAGFECEPFGDLLLTVMTKSKPVETIGEVSISLGELMDPNAKLFLMKWFELKPYNRNANSSPVYLQVAASFTAPVSAPHVFEMLKSHRFSMNACKLPLPQMAQNIRSWTRIIDGYGSDIISLQMRKSLKTGGNNHPILKQSIFGMLRLSRKSYLLAEHVENTWFFKDSILSLRVEQKANQEVFMVELKGFDQLKLFPGRKLEYQPRNAKQANIDEFMTVVEFSAENPYGKAIALFDMKSMVVKVTEEWFVLPALLLAFILSDLLKKGENITIAPFMENLEAAPCFKEEKITDYSASTVVATQAKSCGYCSGFGDNVNFVKGGSCGRCGSGCGGGCGGSGCGDGLAIAKSNGLGGGGCGGGCGGSGCGDGLTIAKSSGLGGGGCAGGCGGSGCGDGLVIVKSSGLGSGGCGGGCGGSGCGDGLAIPKSSGLGSGDCCGGGTEVKVNGTKQASFFQGVTPIGA